MNVSGKGLTHSATRSQLQAMKGQEKKLLYKEGEACLE